MTEPQEESRAGGATTVALGILASRIFGFLRERAFAHYFGVGPHIDVLRVALRAPNALQNLLGEGTLSAAFIPVYTRLLRDGRRDDAGRFAGAVFGLLLAVAGGISLLGALFAKPIVSVLAAGFLQDAAAVQAGTLTVDRFPLAVSATRFIFPMTGLLVLSVWALGILNSHRRFLLPYAAPAVWNAAILAALLWVGGSGKDLAGGDLDRLLFAACFGALAGGLLQFLVQLPAVVRVLHGFRLSFSPRVTGVPEALRAFAPVLAGRGVVQLSGYLDLFLATFLSAGAVSAMGFAQMFYMLPVSLFGMSVAAAELPELARLGAERRGELIERVRRSLAGMAFLNVPTLVGYLAFGFLLVGALYRTGRFRVEDNWLVYLVLSGYTLGLLATTSSRLLQNSFYALGQARIPARVAALRVAVSAVTSIGLMLLFDRLTVAHFAGAAAVEDNLHLGALGLALAASVGAWLEFALLTRALRRLTSASAFPLAASARMIGLALVAALPAALAWWLLRPAHVLVQAAVVLGLYGAAYLGLAAWRGLPEMAVVTVRLGRLRRR
jgi:putative peptidoglycan lipid II flippase